MPPAYSHAHAAYSPAHKRPHTMRRGVPAGRPACASAYMCFFLLYTYVVHENIYIYTYNDVLLLCLYAIRSDCIYINIHIHIHIYWCTCSSICVALWSAFPLVRGMPVRVPVCSSKLRVCHLEPPPRSAKRLTHITTMPRLVCSSGSEKQPLVQLFTI